MTHPTITTRPAAFDAAVAAKLTYLHKMAPRFVDRRDCEDLVQDTIAAALQRWESYDPTNTLTSWLAFQMRGVAGGRRRSKRQSHECALHDELPIDLGVAADQHAALEARMALETLSDDRGDRVLVQVGLGYKQHEIGEAMGITKQRVHQLANAARERFRRRVRYA